MQSITEHRPSMEIVSWSTNLERGTLNLLVQRLATIWPAAFTAPCVAEMTDFFESLKREDYSPFSHPVEHAGEITSFGIVAYHSDTGLLELDFFSFPELIASIEEEHERLCAELAAEVPMA